MSEENGKKIIEINGVKMEVDMRSAAVKSVEAYKVGDLVRVLQKNYGDSWNAYNGVVVGFENFKARPGITICYITEGYADNIKLVTFNSDTKDLEFCPGDAALIGLNQESIIGRLNRDIDSKRAAYEDAIAKKKYAEALFGAYFKSNIPAVE